MAVPEKNDWGRLFSPISEALLRKRLSAECETLAAGCSAQYWTMMVMTHFALWMIGLVGPETQTSARERQCLSQFANTKCRLAEIGVWHGVTTCCLRRAMAADGVLLCIDPFPVGRFGFSAQRMIARRELSRIRNGNLRWLRATGKEAALSYDIAHDGAIEFLFIDGDHTYEGLRQDWEGWSPLITRDGVVALHDSRSSVTRRIDDAGSVVFTREVIHRDERFEVVDTVDTLTVLRRR